jgi:putative peptide zinc metalloprotease protein
MPSWLKQALSYVLSFVVYAWFLNPKVALVIMGAISFHECGHLYAAKSMGLKTKGFYLIPFMGGAALIAERYKRYSQMSFVVLAGPLSGAALAAAFYGLYLVTGSTFIGVTAYWMALLNLFNLIPMAMLDGGQFVEAVLYSINDLVAAIFLTASYTIAAFVLWFVNPILAGMAVFFGLPTVLNAWRNYNWKRQGQEYLIPSQPDRMNPAQIVLSLAGYFFIVAVLSTIAHLCNTNSLQIHQLFQR